MGTLFMVAGILAALGVGAVGAILWMSWRDWLRKQ